jgi:hypothetical protein
MWPENHIASINSDHHNKKNNETMKLNRAKQTNLQEIASPDATKKKGLQIND